MCKNGKCGCFSENHIWDTDYDKQIKSERYCICCEHFFLSQEAEDDTLDGVIELSEKTNNSTKTPVISISGMNKGKIVRRI